VTDLQTAAREALLALIRLGFASAEVIEVVLLEAASQGADRRALLQLLSSLLRDLELGLPDDQENLLDNIWAHLLGQCSVADIIRLPGDPENLDEFARHVYEQTRDWSRELGGT